MTIRPIIIEVIGPKFSGKSTLIDNLAEYLKEKNFSVAVIKADNVDFECWHNTEITFHHLLSILETLSSNSYDIVLIEQGYYHTLFSCNILANGNNVKKQNADILSNFFDNSKQSIDFSSDLVFSLDISLNESIRRSKSNNCTLNYDKKTISLYKKEFALFNESNSCCTVVDTTAKTPNDVLQFALDVISTYIKLD